MMVKWSFFNEYKVINDNFTVKIKMKQKAMYGRILIGFALDLYRTIYARIYAKNKNSIIKHKLLAPLTHFKVFKSL
jgi:hypothetical protein